MSPHLLGKKYLTNLSLTWYKGFMKPNYDYQAVTHKSVIKHWEVGKDPRGYVHLSTSGGKTDIFLELADELNRRGLSVFIKTKNENFQIDQWINRAEERRSAAKMLTRGQSLLTVNPYRVREVTPELLSKGDGITIIGHMPSLLAGKSSLGEFKPYAIFFDEAHVECDTENVIAFQSKWPKVKRLYMTATPWGLFTGEGKLSDVPCLSKTTGQDLFDAKIVENHIVEIWQWRLDKGSYKDFNDKYELLPGTLLDSEVMELARPLINNVLLRTSNFVRDPSIYYSHGIFKKLTKNTLGKILGGTDQTLWIAHDQKMAKLFHDTLVGMGLEAGVDVGLSTSKTDKDSDVLNRFAEHLTMKHLVVVDRGGVGYSNNELFNVVDVGLSINPRILNQQEGRIDRRSQKSDKLKLYIKVCMSGPGAFEITEWTMAFASWLRRRDAEWDGKMSSAKTIKIPRPPRERKPVVPGVKKDLDIFPNKKIDGIIIPNVSSFFSSYIFRKECDKVSPSSHYDLEGVFRAAGLLKHDPNGKKNLIRELARKLHIQKFGKLPAEYVKLYGDL